MRHSKNVKRQNIFNQNRKNKENSILMVTPEVNQGIQGLNMSNGIGLEHYLILAACIFSIGIVGLFLHRKNVITILMSIELMLLAVNINFVAFSAYSNEMTGQIVSLIILTIAAAETAIGLAILLVYFRNKGSIAINDANQMTW